MRAPGGRRHLRCLLRSTRPNGDASAGAGEGQRRGTGGPAGADDIDPTPANVSTLPQGKKDPVPVGAEAQQPPILDHHGVRRVRFRHVRGHRLEVWNELGLVGAGHAETGKTQARARLEERFERLRLERDVDGVDAPLGESTIMDGRGQAPKNVAPEDAVYEGPGSHRANTVRSSEDLRGDLARGRLAAPGGEAKVNGAPYRPPRILEDVPRGPMASTTRPRPAFAGEA